MNKVKLIKLSNCIHIYLMLSILISISVISGEKQLKEFSVFLQKHQAVLDNIISRNSIISMDEEINKEMCSILECAEKTSLHIDNSSIRMNYSFDPESISTMGLIQSDNKCLNKTIGVFVQLCLEVRQLSSEGNPMLRKFILANEELYELLQIDDQNDQMDFEKSSSSSHTEQNKMDEISLSPDVIIKMSSLLELLFQAQQFIERCYLVISEIIKQFSAVFNVESSTYINIDYSSLHFQVSTA